jgi:hypothetical protein
MKKMIPFEQCTLASSSIIPISPNSTVNFASISQSPIASITKMKGLNFASKVLLVKRNLGIQPANFSCGGFGSRIFRDRIFCKLTSLL